MPGIEPGAFHMQSERATTALHPRPDKLVVTIEQTTVSIYWDCSLPRLYLLIISPVYTGNFQIGQKNLTSGNGIASWL